MSKICCVYQIQNIRSGHRYIGGTINYIHRRRQHLCDLRGNKHYSKKLQLDFNAIGEPFFAFSMLEDATEENLEKTEQYWLDKLEPEYNSSRFARTPDQRLVGSEEAQKNLSNSIKKLWADGHYDHL